jgi:Cu2+-exporting ATPase
MALTNHRDHHHHDDSEGSSSAPDDHGGHVGHEDIFRQKFWISLLLTIPVVLYSHMVQE